eukprot:2485934-Pyramimonas_sp.AAC.1
MGLAFGACNWKLGNNQKAIQARAGVVLQVCINSGVLFCTALYLTVPHCAAPHCTLMDSFHMKGQPPRL